MKHVFTLLFGITLLSGIKAYAQSQPIDEVIIDKNGQLKRQTAGKLVPLQPSSQASSVVPALRAARVANARAIVAGVSSETIAYSGQIITYTVPTGVTSLTIEARGGQGANGESSAYQSGKGAIITGTVSVTPGQQLKILVGQQPTGLNGGGGGTFVTDANNTPLVIAGGGGGSGSIDNPVQKQGQAGRAGGNGAGSNNGTGGTDGNGGRSPDVAGYAAYSGGGLLTNGQESNANSGHGKAFVNGGGGGDNFGPTFPGGGFGGGGTGSGNSAGGGGGGYSGGGNGGRTSGGVGGGGGSYNVDPMGTNIAGDNSGNGLVIINYTAPSCSPFTINLTNDGPLTCAKNSVTLTTRGEPTGAAYVYSSGATANLANPAIATAAQAGPYSVTVTIPGGCSATATTTVTSNTVAPSAPVIATQSGGPYPAGVSTLTISQNTGNVILGVSGCQDGTITWNGGNATTLAVSTSNLGTQSFTATCTSNSTGCTSPVATATVTVVTPTLKVLSRDPDNGQLNNNTVKPYLLLQNAGTTPISYSTITLRYWLTTENNIPLNFQKNYVQIGQGNLNLRYVPLNPARQGATGYIEYSFSAGAGSLAPNGDSGPLEVQATKQDYSSFFQPDDYSYINNSSFTLNPRITAYQNGVIFYGQEPTGTGSARTFVEEASGGLAVKVLGNPVVGQSAEVEISGVGGQVVQLKLVDLQGKTLHGQSIKEAGIVERVSLPLGNAQGILLLDVSTATQRQQIKLVRP